MTQTGHLLRSYPPTPRPPLATWSRGDGEQCGCPRTCFPENYPLPFPWEPDSCGHGVYLETGQKHLPLMAKVTSTWGPRGQGRCLGKPCLVSHSGQMPSRAAPALKAHTPSGQPAQSSTLGRQPEAGARTTPRHTIPRAASLGFEEFHTLPSSGPHETPYVAVR